VDTSSAETAEHYVALALHFVGVTTLTAAAVAGFLLAWFTSSFITGRIERHRLLAIQHAADDPDWRARAFLGHSGPALVVALTITNALLGAILGVRLFGTAR
jgi:hypothetical protein